MNKKTLLVNKKTLLDMLKGFALAGLLLFALGLILRATSATAQPTHPELILAPAQPAFPPQPAFPQGYRLVTNVVMEPVPTPRYYYAVCADGLFTSLGTFDSEGKAMEGHGAGSPHFAKHFDSILSSPVPLSEIKVHWQFKPGLHTRTEMPPLPPNLTVK